MKYFARSIMAYLLLYLAKNDGAFGIKCDECKTVGEHRGMFGIRIKIGYSFESISSTRDFKLFVFYAF